MDNKIYSSRLLLPYLKLLREKYPHVNVNEILTYSSIDQYEIRDEACWFSQLQVDRFYEKCVYLTGNIGIARDAGRVAASPGLLGVLQQHTFGLLGPHLAFKILNQLSKRLSLASDYQSRLHTRNKVEITATPYSGVHEKPYQCENRKGMFEAIVTGFHLDLPKIEHPECLFDGGSCCRYIITWKRDLAHRLGIVRNFISSALIAFIFPGYVFLPINDFFNWLAALLVLSLGFSLATEKAHQRQMTSSMDTLRDSSVRLEELINANNRNVQLVNEIGTALVNKISVQDVLSDAIHAMESSFGFDCGVIMLANSDRTLLEVRESFGLSSREVAALKATPFNLRNPDSHGPFIVSFRDKKPIIVEDTFGFKGNYSERSQELVETLNIHSFLCCPIVVEDVSLGVIAVTNQSSKRPLVRSDVNLLQGIAPVIGIALTNADLIEDLAERDKLLAESNRDLEAKVALRTEELVAARDLAMGANRAKSQFLANTNHELRTPLHAVIGYTSLLKEEFPEGEDSELFSYVELIEKNAETLLSMINTILDLAKIEAGHMVLNLEDIKASSLVTEAKDVITPLIAKNNNRLVVDNQLPEDKSIKLDRIRVLQILLNLLSNAAKFTVAGEITFSAGIEGTNLIFTVKDTGVGIPDKNLDTIFDAFIQVDEDQSRTAKGTGLGLTITREFCELMGGIISVQSNPDEGSVFKVVIPIPEGH